MTWTDLVHPAVRSRTIRTRGDDLFYGCGHPRILANTVCPSNPRCRICRQKASAEYRAKHRDYYLRYYREHIAYFREYMRAYRGSR